MVYMRRWRFCAQCGKPLYGRYPPHKEAYCLPCRMSRAEKAALEMAAKSGPYYDRWLETRGPRGRPRRD